MIFILPSSYPDQANWYSDFSSNLYQGLIKIKADVGMLSIGYIENLTSSDYVFVTHYKDLDNELVRRTKATIIFHQHGSGASPYTHWIDAKAELDHLYNVIDVLTFCMPTQEKLVKERYKFVCTSKTIGFPIDFEKYKPYKQKKKKKIVIPGHIGPERQFYLATYLLKDLIPEYEVVFSVCEKPDCVTGKWSPFYDLDRFRRMGFQFNFHPDQQGFYRELSDASHVFTCSLGDTFSVSILEGSLLGCTPVVPNIYDGWPQYTDYISFGYVPFSKSNVEAFIKENITIPVNYDWFKPELVAERLLEVLE